MASPPLLWPHADPSWVISVGCIRSLTVLQIHSMGLPRSFKTEWTVEWRSKPLWPVVAALDHDRQEAQRTEDTVMAKCLVKIQTRRGLRLQLVNHCNSNVFVRLLRHSSKITARNTGACPAVGSGLHLRRVQASSCHSPENVRSLW